MADTPSDMTENAHSRDAPESLEDLLAQATAHYAKKNYKTAAERYSRATELQASINGEMSTKNADLLYLYGRCLYHVAVEKSDVLGSKVAGEKESGSKIPAANTTSSRGADVAVGEEKAAEDVVTAAAFEAQKLRASESRGVESKAHFQFQGDENFDGSDDEERAGEDAEEGVAEEEEEDDLSNAFEILDLARVLLQRKLEEVEGNTDGEGRGVGDSEAKRQLKERLADTHDLQAEISLEGEQFHNAVNDLRAALALKQELHPPDSSLVAEMHYKLSLALEFCSVTQQKDENGEIDQVKTAHVDEAMREEAAREMEAAITSCKLRIKKEEEVLASGMVNGTTSKSKISKRSIGDVKEMVQDMEQRLIELRQPPVSIKDPRSTGSLEGSSSLSGILGSILGESVEAQRARLDEATKEAKDLTDLVKRKKASVPIQDSPDRLQTAKAGIKRKVEFAEEIVELETGKKAKVEEGDA